MACRTFPVPGGFGIACDRSRRPSCSAPNCHRPSERQCDYPVKGRKSGTCDRHLCGSHATSAGPQTDYCPPHAKLVAANGSPPGSQGDLFP